MDKLTIQSEKPKSTDPYTAVRWSAASKYGAQAVQFGVSLFLARLLAPEYFGLLGMATVITGFAKTLKNLGFNAAIVQRSDIDQKLLSTLFWVNLGFCISITTVLVCASPAVAWIYRDVRVTPLVAVLSLNITINSFCTVPSALLQKQLAFKKLAIREIGAVVVSGAVGISCAILGWGVWALVAAAVSSSLVGAILLNAAEPFVPSLVLDRSRLKECLKFGLNITGFNLFNYFARNADNLIIGVFLGPIALGYYSLAYRFMLLPRDSISRVVSRVLFPKLSQSQDDDKALSRIFLKTCGAIAFVSFPIMFGFAVLADSIISHLIGEKWAPAILVVMILSPLGAIQSIWTPIGQLYLAKGRSDRYFRFGVIGGVLFVLSFLAGVPWGIVGVATSYAVMCLVWIPLSYSDACKDIDGLTVGAIWREVRCSIGNALVMAFVVFTVQTACQYCEISKIAELTMCIAAGCLVYSVASYASNRKALADLSPLCRFS